MARKRANGEGTITRRKDGLYAASVTLGWVYDPERGKARQDRRWKYSRSYREVKAWRDEQIARRDQGRLSTERIETVGEFLTVWLEEVVKPNTRYSTALSYAGHTRTYFVPLLGDVPLEKLTARHITALRNSVADSGCAPSTVGHVMLVLSVALNVAVDWGLLSYNPVARVDRPRAPRRERPVLSKDQATLLLAVIARDRLFALYVLEMMFGLRIGEVCGLRWQDVDFERGRLTVRHQLQRQAGRGLVLIPVKSESGKREITMPRLAVDVLRRHREARTEDGDFVFAEEGTGEPLDPRRVRHMWRGILDRAGLPPMRFHDLRHTAGTRLAEEGVDVSMISSMLGHSSPAITRQLYLHTTPRMKQGLADRLDEMFSDMGLSTQAVEGVVE